MGAGKGLEVGEEGGIARLNWGVLAENGLSTDRGPSDRVNVKTATGGR